jgi:CRISPR/Cas system-associated exonuclease Cas4 (RecB family)
MARKLMGPVRQAAYDAAEAARLAATTTSDAAKKSILQLTEKGLMVLGKLCDVADEIQDGVSLTVKVWGKEMPIEIKLNLKEK